MQTANWKHGDAPRRIPHDCPKMAAATCFHCGKEGHFASSCPEQAVTVACRHCGKHGHEPRDCPDSIAWKATQPCRLFQRDGKCSRTNCLFSHAV